MKVIFLSLCLTAFTIAGAPVAAVASEDAASEPARRDSELERSYWVHASLGMLTQRGYFGPTFPATAPPTREEVFNAAGMLTGPYAANRLYLIYHEEMTIADACRVFRWWREACPASVELIPTLVLRMYDRERTPVFTQEELAQLAAFFREHVHPTRLAVYDIHPKRDQGESLSVLARLYDEQLIRVGIQPDEPVQPPFVAAVQDTWSGFCHGTRNEEDWLTPGFGAQTLRRWVAARNPGRSPITWNLIVVAWDYRDTERGGYPGYDDADRNMPLPAHRNRLGAQIIRATADPQRFGGFSSDLYILHENSRSPHHDGPAGAFYQTLKRGERYDGYYADPFHEIVDIYKQLQSSND